LRPPKVTLAGALRSGVTGGRWPAPLGRAWVFAIIAVLIIVIITVAVNAAVATTLSLLFLPNLLMLLLLLPPIILVGDIEGGMVQLPQGVTTDMAAGIILADWFLQ
jgi:hypothetical protein